MRCTPWPKSALGVGHAAPLRQPLLLAALLFLAGSASSQPPAPRSAAGPPEDPPPLLQGESLSTLRIVPRSSPGTTAAPSALAQQSLTVSAQAEQAAARILVSFRESISPEEKLQILSRLPVPARLVPGPGSPYFDVLEVAGQPEAATQAVRALSGDPRVRVAEQDAAVQIHAVIPNDPRFPEQWFLRNTAQRVCIPGDLPCARPGADISASEAWSVSTGSSSVIVAVIDTGVDYRHPDLAANILRDSDGKVVGYDFANSDADPDDDNGHGTHCAGLIGAVGGNGIGITGVAWKVSIMPVKALGASGQGRLSDIIAAVDFAVEHGAHIINASFGSSSTSRLFLEAIQRAGARGVLVVASAGNAYYQLDYNLVYPARYSAEASNVITVAASDWSDGFSPFSSYGPEYCGLAAPGISMLSTVPSGSCTLCTSSGYQETSGTSMSAALVSGAAALIKAHYPEADARQMRDRLLYSSDLVEGVRGYVRYGRLNAARALQEDRIAPAAPARLTVAGVTRTSLRLRWQAPADNSAQEPVSDYRISYGASQDMAAATVVSAGIRPAMPGAEEVFDLTGLNPDTEYFLAVRAVDRAGNVSDPVYAGPVRTLPALLFEGAESLPLSDPDNGRQWRVVDGGCRTGKRCFAGPSSTIDGPNPELRPLEPFLVRGPSYLSFWVRHDFPRNQGGLMVWVDVNATEFFHFDVPDPASAWRQVRIDLSAFQGSTVSFRFVAWTLDKTDEPPFSRVRIDDIAIIPLQQIWMDDVEGAPQFTGFPPWSITTEDNFSPTRSWTDSPGGPYQNNVLLPLMQDSSVEAGNFASLCLRFRARVDMLVPSDRLDVYASPDNGRNWQHFDLLTNFRKWASYSFWLPAGWRQVRVMFVLRTDEGGRDDGVHLDDIGIWGEPFQPPQASAGDEWPHRGSPSGPSGQTGFDPGTISRRSGDERQPRNPR